VDQPRILVVDDDQRLRELLQRYLGEQGFRPSCAEHGEQMDALLQRHDFAALVLDLMMPGEDGLSICGRLRGQGNAIPILILTARGDDIDRIVGLEMGADDYLAKPFNPRELVARLRAILRRSAGAVTSAQPGDASASTGVNFSFGPFSLDVDSCQLFRHGEALKLTSGEFALLKVLAEHARRPLSRDTLISHTRGRDHDPFDRSVDVLVSRLRRIIEDDPGKPRYLQTVRGIGYVLEPDGSRR